MKAREIAIALCGATLIVAAEPLRQKMMPEKK